jgi:phosphoribosylamine--glycine ligase / phosphoribosylformylglycinamidine cyclo-ligase
VESLDENDRQVVKASGLAAGKGVLLPTSKAETIDAVKEIMSDRAFGAAGDTCVIESFMSGPELLFSCRLLRITSARWIMTWA